jgi:hypothetical protein
MIAQRQYLEIGKQVEYFDSDIFNVSVKRTLKVFRFLRPIVFLFLMQFLLSLSLTAHPSDLKPERPARFDTIKDTVCTGEMIRFHQEVEKWKSNSRWRITNESGEILDSLQYPFSCKMGGWIQLTHFLEMDGKLDSFSRSLFVATTPDAELPQNLSLCEGEAVIFNFPEEEEFNVLWQDGSEELKYVIERTGNYAVQISDRTGKCKIGSKFFVKVLPMPEATLAPDYYICENETIWIEVKDLRNVKSLIWNNGSTFPDPEITTPGDYTVTLQNGVCETKLSTYVHPDDCRSCEFYFSEELDLKSTSTDLGWIWRTNCDAYEILNAAIFNPWGQSVYIFRPADPVPWDGTCGNDYCPAAYYNYFVDVEVLDERGEWKQERYTGIIRLIK